MYTRLIPSENELNQKRDLFYFQFFFQILSLCAIAIVLYLMEDIVKGIFFSKDAPYSILIASGVMLSTAFFGQYANYFRYTHRVKYTSIVNFIHPYLHIMLIILAIRFVPILDLNYLMIVLILSYILLSIPIMAMVTKEIGISFPTMKLKKIRDNIRVGFPLILVLIVDFVLSGSDRFMIAFFMTTKDVGYYNPAYTLGVLMIIIPKMIGVALPPLLAHASSSGKEGEVEFLIEKSMKIFLVFSIPYSIGCLIVGDLVIGFLANEEVATASFLIAPLVGLSTIFYGITYIISNTTVYLSMKTKLVFHSYIIAAILNLILNAVLFLIFHKIIIAAITTLISYIIAFIYIQIKTKNLIKINYHKDELFKIIIASSIMGLFLHSISFLNLSNELLLLNSVLFGALLYFVLLLLLRVIDTNELRYIKQLFGRRD